MSNFEKSTAAQIAAIKLVRKSGGWKDAGSAKVLWLEQGLIQIAYRTPFQRAPAETETNRYVRAVFGGKRNLPHGLDVWHNRKKVMNVEWDDDGNRDLISFRSGSWEDDIRQLLEV